MSSQILRHILSCTTVPEDSQRQDDIPAPSNAPAATEAQAITPATTEAQTTAPAPATEDPSAPSPTQDVSARQRGLFTFMLLDQSRTIDLDIDTAFSLHDSDISQIGRALHDTTVNFQLYV